MTRQLQKQHDEPSNDVDRQVDYDRYRVLSMRAVAAIAFGIISVPAVVLHGLIPIALLGVVIGLNAVRAIRGARNELTGYGLAWTGLSLALVGVVGGIGGWAYVYGTEVPDGYSRISFVQLQPDAKHPEIPVSPTALDLDGKPVFIKGFIYPADKQTDLQQFVLVPDRGTCCFGGQPKLTDMIEVTLRDPLRVRYSFRMKKLTGTLRVDTQTKPVNGLGGVYYQLEADSIK